MAIDVRSRLGIDDSALADFCRKWQIVRLELFGSALREDFRPDSDVDLLVTFAEDAPWSLLDIVHLEGELSDLLGRKAEIAERRAIEQSDNPFRRRRILNSAQPLYAA
jgi:predicted nucleotidyltransferase